MSRLDSKLDSFKGSGKATSAHSADEPGWMKAGMYYLGRSLWALITLVVRLLPGTSKIVLRILLIGTALFTAGVLGPAAALGIFVGGAITFLGAMHLTLEPVALLSLLLGGGGIAGCIGLLGFALIPTRKLAAMHTLRRVMVLCLFGGIASGLSTLFVELLAPSTARGPALSKLLLPSLLAGLYALVSLRSINHKQQRAPATNSPDL